TQAGMSLDERGELRRQPLDVLGAALGTRPAARPAHGCAARHRACCGPAATASDHVRAEARFECVQGCSTRKLGDLRNEAFYCLVHVVLEVAHWFLAEITQDDQVLPCVSRYKSRKKDNTTTSDAHSDQS